MTRTVLRGELTAGKAPGAAKSRGHALLEEMDIRREVRDLPRAVKETLEKGRAPYEALARQTRWGEVPVYLIGSGPALAVARAGGYLFEWLLGWPAVVRSARAFQAYTASVLRPRSVLVAVAAGEDTETLEAVRAGRTRGATILVVGTQPQGALSEAADGVFTVEPAQGAVAEWVSLDVGMKLVALVAARALKRPHPQITAMEEDFAKLPEFLDLMVTQLDGAAESLAEPLAGREGLCLAGSGLYHPAALLAAHGFCTLAHKMAAGFEAAEFLEGPASALSPRGALLVLSGSRCRARKIVAEAAARAAETKAPVLAISDSNDRELRDLVSTLAVIPQVTEPAGSTLALALAGWAASRLAYVGYQTPAGRRATPPPSTES